MRTIVTGSLNFKCNILPMRIFTSGDIFKTNIYKILGDINGIKSYIGDIIFLIKSTF